MKLVFLCFILFLVDFSTCCRDITNEKGFHLSTKTRYQLPQIENTYNEYLKKNCKLIHINYIGRHGTRNPSVTETLSLSSLGQSFKNQEGNIYKEYKWILDFIAPKNESAGILLPVGKYELFEIGKRIKSRFKNFFNPFSSEFYQVFSTKVPRAFESASFLINGLFNGSFVEDNGGLVFTNDQENLLRFFDSCSKFLGYLESGENVIEMNLWKSYSYPPIAKRISLLIGLNETMSIKVLDKLFSACVNEASINNNYNDWCSLFTKEDIVNWEYAQDLKQFWTRSYGNQLNYKMASLLFQEIIKDLENSIKGGQDSFSARIRLAHAETLLPIISILGLYKDTYNLYANLTSSQINSRKFKTSNISPYAANLALYLFKCDGTIKISVEHNEVPVLIPGCKGKLCDFFLFKNLFNNALSFVWDAYCYETYKH
ncbi:hypothetical protein CYY_001156 [Polysphondylium violaceum]|uniref:Multiple inositol polyphosphate phosphatase 1 n=1 Tax=Polysphondylium violaceum TaxID=133409 RepID=A0A8J4PYM0_9MYCE|nr:hypothetical protein CYY_001156 [Polysphondylium violaceum]